MTLWSVNGAILHEKQLDGNVVDCACTYFEEGTKENMLYVLTRDGRVISYTCHSLQQKGDVIDMKKEYGDDAFLSVWKNKVLFLTDANIVVPFAIKVTK